MQTAAYILGAELPDLRVDWYDTADALVDFSTGWTFVLKLGQPGAAADLTKSSGITGAATSPNVTVSWATSGELSTLSQGVWHAHLVATRTGDSKQRVFPFAIRLDQAIT